MRGIYRDVRLAIRSLMKQPGFAVVSILTLALGIGATSAIFSVFKTVILQPLPFPESEQLVQLWEHDFTDAREENFVGTLNYLDWKTQRIFESTGAYWLGQTSVVGYGAPEEMKIGASTGDFFSTLRVTPLLGRNIQPGDDKDGAPQVAVITYGLWQRKFNGDRNVIGRSIRINGEAGTIVGVLPEHFIVTHSQAELWTGLVLPTTPDSMRGRFLRVVGRLKPNVTIEQARAHMGGVAKANLAKMPEYNNNMGINVVPMHQQIVGDVQRPLTIVLAAVGILLLIACVNVANLLLSRASTRSKEMAIRAALGASRFRLIRQLLTESAVLSLLGALLGLLLAAWGTALLVRFVPDTSMLPRIEEISVDAITVAVTAVIAIITAILFGLAPAIDASRTDLQTVLRNTSRGSTHGRGGKRFRDLLVGSEIALAVVLLVSAGLLLKSFKELTDVDPGVRTTGAVTMRIEIPFSNFPTGEPQKRIAFYDRLFDEMRAVPGVTHVGATQHMPFGGPGRGDGFDIEGRTYPEGQGPSSDMRAVSGDYFGAMGMKLIAGRTFDLRDRSVRSYVVNDLLAKKYFPNENAIGKRLTIVWNPDDEPSTGEIIGVVGNVRQAGLGEEANRAMYVNWAMSPVRQLTVIASSNVDPHTLIAPLTGVVRRLEPEATVANVKTLDEVVMNTIARPKFNASLLTIFSVLGLFLSAIGIYGVLSYSVAQRTQEIGVRMALGAQPKQVMRFVSREGMTIAVIGLVIGTIGALAATRVLQSLLYGVSATDPFVLGLVWVVVAAVAFLAVFMPARRATKVDPLVALRTE